jgi:hypothetical protein
MQFPVEQPKWMVAEANYKVEMYDVLKEFAAAKTKYLFDALNRDNGFAKIQKELGHVAPLTSITKISDAERFERLTCNNNTALVLHILRRAEPEDESRAFKWYCEMNKQIWEDENMNIHFALELKYMPEHTALKAVLFDDVFVEGKLQQADAQPSYPPQLHLDKRQKAA